MNDRLSQEKDSLLNVRQVQIHRAISSAINDRVLPEIQNIMGDTYRYIHKDVQLQGSEILHH